MKSIKFLLIHFLVLGNAFSQTIIDVYGTNPEKTHRILEKYTAEVGKIEAAFQAEAIKIQRGENDSQMLKKIFPKKLNLQEKIKKEFNLDYVAFQTVFYPNQDTTYTTIEVIEKNQPQRSKWIEPMHQGRMPNVVKNDLIHQMTLFEELQIQIIQKGNIQDPGTCPVYHCVLGFADPQLKPYLKLFNEGAIKEKRLILDTLDHDADPERRAAAAFLTAHFKDPKEIMSVLLAHLTDQDAAVRNNIMRVMSGTIHNAKLYDVKLKPVIAMLDSPQTTDRNKALMVLESAAESAANHQKIATMAGKQLLQLLELKQPDNHDTAYSVLKSISGKNYSDNDIVQWKKWLATQQSI